MFRRLIIKLRDQMLNYPLCREVIEQHVAPPYFTNKELSSSDCEKLVSVIIAVRNCENTIECSLISLLKQTHKNIEIIVINDGSCDSTQEIVERLLETDKRIRLIRLKKSFGTSLARNLGLSICRGNYITFQDGDDYSHPGRIQKQITALKKNQRLSAVLCDYVRIRADGKMVCINSRWAKKCIVSMMFSRKIFRSIGYFKDLQTSEDSDYFERIKAVYGTNSIKLLPQILYKASFSPQSRLFGKGQTLIKNEKVLHAKCPVESKLDNELRNRHSSIISGEKKAYVGKKKALAKFYDKGWITPRRDKITVHITHEDNLTKLDNILNSLLLQSYGRNNLEVFIVTKDHSLVGSEIIQKYRFLPFFDFKVIETTSLTNATKLINSMRTGKILITLKLDENLKTDSIKSLVKKINRAPQIVK